MYLWTEFEGATIDSAYSLNKLLETEGRSAFFTTSNASGESVLIRIIECHFDEEEILARWRGVQALGHPNFLGIDRFGHFLVEGENNITAVYVVFERVDANLGEVLQQGHLSISDAAQIGLSVASALETLHGNGFVHEHIEPRDIYAVGDSVKLRSDCIRESPEGEAGIEARRRDVEGLAAVLAQVLLGWSGSLSVRDQTFLPAPFDHIVRNGTNGNWGLDEMKAALMAHDLPKAAAKRVATKDAAINDRESTKAASSATPSAAPAATPSLPRVDSVPARRSAIDFASKPFWSDRRTAPDLQPDLSASNSGADFALPRHKATPHKSNPLDLPVIFGIAEREFRSWITAGALLLGVVLIGWVVLHYWFSHHAANAAQPTPPAPAVTGSSSPVAKPHAGSRLAPSVPKAAAQPRLQWRVVAFTYNRQDQAQKKASSLQQKYPNLSPAVFSPTGRAPWLVTVGGAMERDAAYALARKAPSLGLPRDTYAQNYSYR
jgi:eukaryotic-like serine/threonine-protein kinase